MPSIQDVADQINARLNLIVTNTQNTAQNTADIRNELQQANAQLGQIENTLAVGLANISQGLFGLLQVQLAAFAELEQNRKQNDTIICELVNANELLCNIMRKAGKLVVLGEATLTSVKRIEALRSGCTPAKPVTTTGISSYRRRSTFAVRLPSRLRNHAPSVAPCLRSSRRIRGLTGSRCPLPTAPTGRVTRHGIVYFGRCHRYRLR